MPNNAPSLANVLRQPLKQSPLLTGNSRIEDIITERFRHPGNQAVQDALGPADHQAFARQAIIDQRPGLKGITALTLAGAIPAYELAKLAGLTKRDQYTSSPSLASVLAGYKGIIQGYGAPY
jgi:hypothetical protein